MVAPGSTRKGADEHMGFFRIVGGIILAVLAIGLAGAIFQTGYMAGAAGTGTAVAGPAYGWGWGWGWGFGGGLFHLLGLFLFVVIFLAILRVVFGGHRRDWGHGPRGGRGWGHDGYGDNPGPERFGPWEDRARQIHDEWHRRQDAAATPPTARPSGASDGGTGATGPSTQTPGGTGG